MNKRIGLTGGIGAGKSAVTEFLRREGYTVVDADEIAREAAAPGEPALEKLREKIGADIFLPDGTLDRQALAKRVFSDPGVRETVNGIFHGDIKARIDRILENCEQTVFVSAPLLFEAGMERMVDEVWLVTADDALRVQRVARRDGLSEEEIRERMQSQMPEAEKRRRAKIIIENNSSLDELYKRIGDLLQ